MSVKAKPKALYPNLHKYLVQLDILNILHYELLTGLELLGLQPSLWIKPVLLTRMNGKHMTDDGTPIKVFIPPASEGCRRPCRRLRLPPPVHWH